MLLTNITYVYKLNDTLRLHNTYVHRIHFVIAIFLDNLASFVERLLGMTFCRLTELESYIRPQHVQIGNDRLILAERRSCIAKFGYCHDNCSSSMVCDASVL